MGARGKQAQLAQANGSKFNLLLMLVAQMSTYPRAIATHYCSWGSRNFKLTHGALTAFEDLGVVAVAVPRRARRCFSARLRRPPTRHRNRSRLLLQNLRSFDRARGASGGRFRAMTYLACGLTFLLSLLISYCTQNFFFAFYKSVPIPFIFI